MNPDDEDRAARVTLSFVAEPGEPALGALLRCCGPGEVVAAVYGGFFSVADDRVSVLARDAQLGSEVDTSAARASLDEAVAQAEGSDSGSEEPGDVRYYRALLRAAGEPADRA